MPERRPLQSADTIPPLDLKPGIPFHPFAGTELKVDPLELDEWTDVAKVPIMIGDVPGAIFLVSPLERSILISPIDTPMGPVRWVKSIDNGKEKVDELPLSIILSLDVSSFEQLSELQRYRLVFNFRGKEYPLSLIDPNDMKDIGIDMAGGYPLTNDLDTARDGKSFPLLPYDPATLGEITAVLQEAQPDR